MSPTVKIERPFPATVRASITPTSSPATQAARDDVVERLAMVQRRWAGNVLYYSYTPTTIAYDVALDAFTVAQADVFTPDRHHRLTLSVVISGRASTASAASIEEAIQRGQLLLETLIGDYQSLALGLTADSSHAFDLTGRRLR